MLNIGAIMEHHEDSPSMEDIFEADGRFGIVCQYSKGFLTERRITGLYVAPDISATAPSFVCQYKHEMKKFLMGFCHLKVYPFKNRLISLLYAEDDGGFSYADLDRTKLEFHTISETSGLTIRGSEDCYAFKDVMFIRIRFNTGLLFSTNGLLFSTNGLQWKKSDIDTCISDIVFDGTQYYAICIGKEGYITVYSSETGEKWVKYQEIMLSVETVAPNKVAVAGNNTLLIFNGSVSGKYLICKDESLSQCSKPQDAQS